MGRRVLKYNGVVYTSREKLIERIGKDKEGRLEEYLDEYHLVIYKAKEYKSLSELASKHCVMYHTFVKRLAKGVSIEEAIKQGQKDIKEKRKLVYKEKEFESVKALAEGRDINYATLFRRIDSGWSINDAVERPIRV